MQKNIKMSRFLKNMSLNVMFFKLPSKVFASFLMEVHSIVECLFSIITAKGLSWNSLKPLQWCNDLPFQDHWVMFTLASIPILTFLTSGSWCCYNLIVHHGFLAQLKGRILKACSEPQREKLHGETWSEVSKPGQCLQWSLAEVWVSLGCREFLGGHWHTRVLQCSAP